MMTLDQWAKQLLLGTSLEDKLVSPEKITWQDFNPEILPHSPGRLGSLQFSENQMKFPKGASLTDPLKKSQAFHSFANHELLAIEMMAAAILCLPHRDETEIKAKIGLVKSIKDEQKHLKLYQRRMNEHGYELGNFPLNDFFWKQMPKLTTLPSFLALMSMTFEAANLDFALHYQKIFTNLGDEKSAETMRVVFEDEISHVAFGATWLKQWRKNKTLWDYYLEVLPAPLTPARSKGITFFPETRLQAGFPQAFVDNLSSYQDNFRVTNRREWKA